MKLIVGLGNPGKKYDKTRHNIGYDVIDAFADKHGIMSMNKGFQGLYYKGVILNKPVILLKPTTYMNLSGNSVASVSSMYKIPPEDILIIYDDMDLDVGRIRLRGKGSAGSHNGMKSVIESMGNNRNIARLRIGIGKSNSSESKNFVLSHFSKTDREHVEVAVEKACEVVEYIIKTDDIVGAMNEFNSNKSVREVQEGDKGQQA